MSKEEMVSGVRDRLNKNENLLTDKICPIYIKILFWSFLKFQVWMFQAMQKLGPLHSNLLFCRLHFKRQSAANKWTWKHSEMRSLGLCNGRPKLMMFFVFFLMFFFWSIKWDTEARSYIVLYFWAAGTVESLHICPCQHIHIHRPSITHWLIMS